MINGVMEGSATGKARCSHGEQHYALARNVNVREWDGPAVLRPQIAGAIKSEEHAQWQCADRSDANELCLVA